MQPVKEEPGIRKGIHHDLSSTSRVQLNLSSLNRDGVKSAFTPYKPATVLTNLQRGNVQTKTPSVLPERSIHQLAAQGELTAQDIERVADIDERDDNGCTPLMWACSYGQLGTVQLLLHHGASVFAVSNLGENALLYASANGHASIVKELLDHNVDINVKDEEGNTALMYAAHGNHVQCAHELLSTGIDFTAENNSSDTAFEIAINSGSKQVQGVIEKHMLTLITEVME